MVLGPIVERRRVLLSALLVISMPALGRAPG